MFLAYLLTTFAELPGTRGAEAVVIDSCVLVKIDSCG